MWLPVGNGGKKEGTGLVAIAIDHDKGSQHALRWTIDNVLPKDQSVVLIHVVHRAAVSSSPRNAFVSEPGNEVGLPHKHQLESQTKDLFVTFHCFCTRRNIQCIDVILEDSDVVKAITEYVSFSAIQTLVLGATSKHGLIRFKSSSISSSVSKGAPDFCTVYIISKGKISSVRNASRPAPFTSPLLEHMQKKNSQINDPSKTPSRYLRDRETVKPQTFCSDSNKSPIYRAGKGFNIKQGRELSESESDTDISFISSRPSSDRASFPYEYADSGPRLSSSTDQSFASIYSGKRLSDLNSPHGFSSFSRSSGKSSSSNSPHHVEDVDAEMRRLQLELKQTIQMYSSACKDAFTAKQKAVELHRWRLEEERKMEEARLAQEASLSIAEKERAKCRAAMEEAEAAKRLAKTQVQKRDTAAIDPVAHVRYRKYTIEEIERATQYFDTSRKIGEGGYGPVFMCYLDHTPVAVKVLRPDANQGRVQFQQEIDILSCIRHPNIVLLLGACPEYGCLVYEYMAKGSLEDRLLRKGNSAAIPWQFRFRITAEIAMGLLFLHQTKPEPIVHRDLKPGNILLDNNYVSKIGDVGLARLVPAVAENVTQYCVTSAAGTLCYIDPEYQQTGVLGVKSDVYSFGILVLQLLTAKPPMGLTHHVEQSIEKGTFAEFLDPAVPDWPVEETLCLAKLALRCAELRRKDRPDLGKVVMPELIKLREFSEDKTDPLMFFGRIEPTHTSIAQDYSENRHTNSATSNSYSSMSSGVQSGLTGG